MNLLDKPLNSIKHNRIEDLGRGDIIFDEELCESLFMLISLSTFDWVINPQTFVKARCAKMYGFRVNSLKPLDIDTSPSFCNKIFEDENYFISYIERTNYTLSLLDLMDV